MGLLERLRVTIQCEWLGTHVPATPVYFTLAKPPAYHATCARCGRKLLVENGRWHALAQSKGSEG